MKKLSIILFLTFGTCCVLMAQQVPDTVKIRLETSSGAEIGIDGDISSTNVLTKRVAVGNHKVVVKFGGKYTQEYDLNVTSTDNQTYTFPIAGKVNISSTPNADVFIDGIRLGQSPLTAELLGDHNIRLEGDDILYFPTTERIRVNPLEDIDKQYTLNKRPPRLYGFAMGTWSPKGFGGFLGICRRWGWYLHFATNGGDSGVLDNEKRLATDGQYGPGYYKKGDNHYNCFTTGLMIRCHKNIYAYGGAGYGEYAQEYTNVYGGDSDYITYGINGVAAELGVIVKWKALLLSGGYKTIFGDAYPSSHKHNEFYVGIGFTLHKQKKNR